MALIACPLCTSSSFEEVLTSQDRLHRTDDRVFTLVKCEGCGLRYVNPQPTWQELQKYYPSNYISHMIRRSKEERKHPSLKRRVFSCLSRWRRRWWPDKVPAYLNASRGKFLDVGCGNGHLLESMRVLRPDWEFYGVEPVELAAREARRRGFHVKTSNLESAHFSDDFFDVVFLSHVLEHVPQPAETLREVHRILRPEGTLVLMVPNLRSVGALLFGKHWYPLDLPRHLTHFTPRTLTRLACQAHLLRRALRFDKNPKHFLKSFRLWRGRGDLNLQSDHFPPFVWWGLKPFSHLLGLLGWGDVMYAEFQKKSLHRSNLFKGGNDERP